MASGGHRHRRAGSWDSPPQALPHAGVEVGAGGLRVVVEQRVNRDVDGHATRVDPVEPLHPGLPGRGLERAGRDPWCVLIRNVMYSTSW